MFAAILPPLMVFFFQYVFVWKGLTSAIILIRFGSSRTCSASGTNLCTLLRVGFVFLSLWKYSLQISSQRSKNLGIHVWLHGHHSLQDEYTQFTEQGSCWRQDNEFKSWWEENLYKMASPLHRLFLCILSAPPKTFQEGLIHRVTVLIPISLKDP